MRPIELLYRTIEGFVFLLSSNSLLGLWCDHSGCHATPSTLSFRWMPNGRGTCRRHSDAQISKEGIRHSGVYSDNDVPYSLEYVLFILF